MKPPTFVRTVLLRLACASMLVFTSPSPPAAALQAKPYQVGTGDVLTITVYGDAGLTGLFPVSAEGVIGYPLLGNITVVNMTVDEIGAQISRDLSTHMANRSVAVAVKEYAPIFIVGDVQKPGRYEFRPGMIALELFALGGGARVTSARIDMSAIQLISAQQEYEDMSLQLLSQDVRRVRLEAERNNVPFRYEGNRIGPARDPAVLEKIVSTEQSVYALRLSVLEAEKQNLEVQRQNFVHEIETLEKGNIMRNEQFQLLGLDVDASAELVSRGAASQAALRERKRELLAMNQQLLESTSFLARAQQNKNEVERRVMELESKRRNDAVSELREIELNMIRLRKKMAFSVETMAEIGVSSRRMMSLDQMVQTRFSVVRQISGAFDEIGANEHTSLRPGDVVRVTILASSSFETAKQRVDPGDQSSAQ